MEEKLSYTFKTCRNFSWRMKGTRNSKVVNALQVLVSRECMLFARSLWSAEYLHIFKSSCGSHIMQRVRLSSVKRLLDVYEAHFN